MLAAALAWGIGAWLEIGDTEMGVVGYLALIGGVVATLALGMGLMGLAFYSSRRGYDDIDRRDGPR